MQYNDTEPEGPLCTGIYYSRVSVNLNVCNIKCQVYIVCNASVDNASQESLNINIINHQKM